MVGQTASSSRDQIWYILRFPDSIRDLIFFEKGYNIDFGPNHVPVYKYIVHLQVSSPEAHLRFPKFILYVIVISIMLK